jgi:hypothetical protein
VTAVKKVPGMVIYESRPNLKAIGVRTTGDLAVDKAIMPDNR